MFEEKAGGSPEIPPRKPSDANACPDEEHVSRGRDGAFAELQAMRESYVALVGLPVEARVRTVRWLVESFSLDLGGAPPVNLATEAIAPSVAAARANGLVPDPHLSPRDFVSQKKPNSLVERVACLAFYLTHYRGTPHFKTADIVSLNTEAAGHKFGNASRDMDNADRQNGYLVTAGKGAKQLTPRGEAVVEALPDRSAVKAALDENPYKSKARRSRDSAKRTGSSEKDA
jgi:hypothetical protein